VLVIYAKFHRTNTLNYRHRTRSFGKYWNPSSSWHHNFSQIPTLATGMAAIVFVIVTELSLTNVGGIHYYTESAGSSTRHLWTA
jgi:hypothetical protein